MIWVGTDDGNIQLTRDGGKHWENVAGNIRDLPKTAWISSIEAGHFDQGTAFVTVDYHMVGDMRPFVFKTTDFGKSWIQIVSPDGGAVKGYAHVIKEDLVNRNLLFLGTELGLWVTLDGGSQWAQYKGGDLPNVAVRDLVIHPRDNDLIIATHGRGIWIVDDISPLRTLTPEVLNKDIAFIASNPIVQALPAGGGWANGDASFTGPNPTDDAVITYYQKKRHIFGDLKMEVFDASGRSLGTIQSSKRRGLNRATWSMRTKPPRVPSGATGAFAAAYGPRVLPGTYTIKLTKDRNIYTTQLEVKADPRATHTMEDRIQRNAVLMKVFGLLEDMTFAVDQIAGVRSELNERATKVGSDNTLAAKLRALSERADDFRKKIVATKEGGMITGEERLREFASNLYGAINGYDGKPSQTQVERADALIHELADLASEFKTWCGTQLEPVNKELASRQLKPVIVLSRNDWEKK